jgi:hypothetical protein
VLLIFGYRGFLQLMNTVIMNDNKISLSLGPSLIRCYPFNHKLLPLAEQVRQENRRYDNLCIFLMADINQKGSPSPPISPPPPWVVTFIANGYGLMELMQGMNALILKRE